ncbi:MAG: IS30 family transposase [Bacteroidales bacterium]|nr:IS30 family transposase [Bacteroidales bacterium]
MKHLSEGQRYEISALVRAHHTKTEIAAIVGVHKSTITRELKRNGYLGTSTYYPSYAQRKAEQRRWIRANSFKRSTPRSVFETARRLIIDEQYSPEQVVGYCRLHGIRMCSHETLYKWIWKDKRCGGNVYLFLRHRGRKYRKRWAINNSRRHIPNAIDISERPIIVDERSRFGDFEIDTIVGASSRQHILTIVERKVGLLFMARLLKPTAHETADKLIEILTPLAKQGYVKTITADNGLQFAQHERVTSVLGAHMYFARPYHSWERGTNENTNGLIRQYLPKKTNFDNISDQDLEKIQMRLNSRPRKRLGYSTPNEIFKSLTQIDDPVAFRA